MRLSESCGFLATGMGPCCKQQRRANRSKELIEATVTSFHAGLQLLDTSRTQVPEDLPKLTGPSVYSTVHDAGLV